MGTTYTAKTLWKRAQAKQYSKDWEFLQLDLIDSCEDSTHRRVYSDAVNFVEVVGRKKIA